MVKIAAFKGITFNLNDLKDHGALLNAPPYDVLNDEQRAAYHNKHENNILHIDLGKTQQNDPEKYTWHARSAQIMDKWLNEGVLTRLNEPAIFQMETDYIHPETGQLTSRSGFVCLLKLEEFSKTSQVRPHEKTFSSHKQERLSLMKHTKANLSQVFGFFPDSDKTIFNFMTENKNTKPEINFKDESGFTHKVWINKNEIFINSLISKLNNKKVYIADGHHRYETALNYKKFVINQLGNIDENSAVNYLMVYLCPMSDPGLCILATHRLLNTYDDNLISSLSKYFNISEYKFNDLNEKEIRKNLIDKLEASKISKINTFAISIENENKYYLIELKENINKNDTILKDAPAELACLDTYILSNLIFQEIMHMTEEDLDNADLISYVSETDLALDKIKNKKNKVAFLLRPTLVDEILKVSEVGLVMPRKSTYFYPKVTTGLVINKIDAEELIS